jgi:hypothetical protein
MAKTYTELRNNYGVDTKSTATANLSYGDRVMNDFYRRILSKADWPFLHRLRTALTAASTTFVNLPYDVDTVESVFVTVGTTRYDPKPAPNRRFWDQLHYSVQTSDTPEYWFVYNGQIGLWPRPATASNVISINAKIRVADLNVADITSSTITSIANGATTLTVNAGLTAQMVGFWIRPTFSTTANTGDGLWYEIASITSTAICELVRKYGGVSIAAGTAACTIGQMPLLPEAFHDLPEIYAAYRYWARENDPRAADFKEQYLAGTGDLFRAYGMSDLSMILESGDDRPLTNPNLFINA